MAKKSVKSISSKTPAQKRKPKAKTKALSSGGFSPDFIPKVQTEVLIRKNKMGTVLIRVDQEKYIFTLNGVAAEFFMLIDGKRSVSSISKKLISKHAAPEAAFYKKAHELIKTLIKEKLIYKPRL